MNPPSGTVKFPPPCFGLLVGSVHDGSVYTVSQGSVGRNLAPRFWQAPLRPKPEEKEEGTSSVYREWAYGQTLDRFHWRIAHGHIWAELGFLTGSCWGNHIPMADLPLLDTSNEEKGAAELRKKYGDDRAQNAGWFMIDMLGPALEAIELIEGVPRLGKVLGVGDMECDFLPTSKKTWDIFLVYKSRMTVWHCSEKPERDDLLGYRLVKGDKCAEDIETGFHEPFFVYGKPELPFFVTKSGKVFLYDRRSRKETRFVNVWDDAKRPVTTILNDVDTNRTFVAGRDLPEGPDKWFYFELAEKIEKKPFDRAAVASTAEEPLKSALLFARFLAKEGLVKDKPKE